MEFLTVLLSSLMTLASPVGLVVDQVAQKELRSRLLAADQLLVRVDNAPNYQLLRGKVDRVRIAGRGLVPLPDVRLAVLELETDPIRVNPDAVRRGRVQLQQPLRTGVRLVLTQADINQALRSPLVTQLLKDLSFDALGSVGRQEAHRYEFHQPRLEFLERQRLRFQVDLRTVDEPTTLAITIESGIAVQSGRTFQLVEPDIRLNGEPVPAQLTTGLIQGLSQRLDLEQLQKLGLTARILQFNIDRQQVDVAAFVQVAPDAKLLAPAVRSQQP